MDFVPLKEQSASSSLIDLLYFKHDNLSFHHLGLYALDF